MRVICAYPPLREETRRALEGIAEFYRCEGDFGYFELMAELWRRREPWVHVEGDVVPWPGFVEDLVRCPEPYCGIPYRILTSVSAHWGCAKFDASLMERWPSAIEDAGRRPVRQRPGITDGRHWNSLDTRFAEAMMELQGSRSLFLPHWHPPACVHLHVYPPQDTRTTCAVCEGPLTVDHGGLCDDCYRRLYGG